MTGYRSHTPLRRRLSKAPDVTMFFWIVKVLATAVGATFADLLINTLGLGLTRTTMVMTTVLGGVMVIQFHAKRYVPSLYWLVTVLISITGTLVTANLTDTFGISSLDCTIVFASLLAATFAVWRVAEGTLSIRAIDSPRREGFYWLAILLTFALGAAVTDLTAETFDVPYGETAALFALAVAAVRAAHRLPILAKITTDGSEDRHHATTATGAEHGHREAAATGAEHRSREVGTVLAFWTAYVLTHPLGASLGDLISQPTEAGGLGVGTALPGLVFLAAIVGIVAHLTVSHRTHQPHHSAAHDTEDRSSC